MNNNFFGETLSIRMSQEVKSMAYQIYKKHQKDKLYNTLSHLIRCLIIVKYGQEFGNDETNKLLKLEQEPKKY